MPEAQVKMNVRGAGEKASIIDVQGELTAFAESVLMDAYNQASDGQVRAIILNFEDLEYMNSSGIGLLVTLLIRINRETQRISLGMKQLESDPWEGAASKYPVSGVFRGRVTNITDYGAFVELEPGALRALGRILGENRVVLTARNPGMTVEDAYAVQREWADRAIDAGRRLDALRNRLAGILEYGARPSSML
jgi:anti-anti-sigma factor